jgi:prolipoprotein diacylglyceryltransferase
MAVDEGALLVPVPLTLFHGAFMELNAEAVAHLLREVVDFLSVYTVLSDGLAPLLSIGQFLMRLGALCAQDGWGHLPAVNWEGNQSNVYDCVLPLFVTQTEAPVPPAEPVPTAVPMVEDLVPPPPPLP